MGKKEYPNWLNEKGQGRFDEASGAMSAMMPTKTKLALKAAEGRFYDEIAVSDPELAEMWMELRM